MSNEAFENWAKDQEWTVHLGRTTDGSDYTYLQTSRCHDAYIAGRKAALTEAEKACDAVCSEKANDWGGGYNQGALICSAEIRRMCDE